MSVVEEFCAGRVPAHVLLRAEKGRVEELLRRYANAYKIVWERLLEEWKIEKEKLPYFTFYRWVKRNIGTFQPNPTGGPAPTGVTNKAESKGRESDDFNVDEILSEYEEVAKRW